MREKTPSTIVAFLPNRLNGKATLHRYVRTEPRLFVGTVNSVGASAFIYRCDETGTERIWGVES